MPKNPEREGSPRLMSLNDIAVEHGVSRVSIHTYRRRGTFPQPVPVPGTTALRWREDEVAAFFAANPKQPGKRTDLATSRQRSKETGMRTFVLTMRIEADADAAPDQIRQEIYDACSDVSFSFDVTSVEPEAQDG